MFQSEDVSGFMGAQPYMQRNHTAPVISENVWLFLEFKLCVIFFFFNFFSGFGSVNPKLPLRCEFHALNSAHSFSYLCFLSFFLKDSHLEVDSLYYPGGSSRSNPRLSSAQLGGERESGVDIGSLLEDGPGGLGVTLDDSVSTGPVKNVPTSKSILSSFIDSKSRTPLDLIQVTRKKNFFF